MLGSDGNNEPASNIIATARPDTPIIVLDRIDEAIQELSAINIDEDSDEYHEAGGDGDLINMAPDPPNNFKVPMPEFKPIDIVSWFRRLENWFQLMKIASENDRYLLLASQLDHPAIAHLNEWTTPPEQNPYTTVKAKIKNIFEDSAQTRLNKLLEEKPLGDLKPSLLLAEMRNTATGISDDVLRGLWTKRLPDAARPVIAILQSNTLDEAAKAADAVMESIAQASQIKISQISSTDNSGNGTVSNNNNVGGNEIAELRLSISALTRAFDNFKASSKGNNNNNHGRSRSRTPGRNGGNRSESSNNEGNDRDGICRFHRKFGKEARRCLLPCSFTDSKN